LKHEVLDRTMWRTGFGRGYGRVAGRNTEWMRKTHIDKQFSRNGNWHWYSEAL